MKRILASLPLAMLGPLAEGQNIDNYMLTNVPPPPPIVSRSSQALARDAISTTWEVLEQTLDPATGAVTSRTNRYVELGAGLNYLSNPSTGQWAPSEDLIELMSDGSAAALKGPTKLYLKPNLNSLGAVTIVSAEGGVFRTQPIALFWYDPVSGNASLIARAQDCAGELEPPNQVVYRGAFGPVGDLRVTYTKGAVESDLILLQCPELPSGFDVATARLELWHGCQPIRTPKITSHLVGDQGATDDVLDFGGLWFPTGAAYWSDGSGTRAADIPAAVRVPTLSEDGTLAPVCKTWLPGAAEDVLVETVAWNAVAAKLASLPPTAPDYLLPPAQERSSWLAELEATPGPSATSTAAIRQGGGYQPVGLVWDYITVSGSGSYTFNTGETYYLSSNGYFSGNLTFNPCVIKFSPQTWLMTYGGLTCNGSSSSPTILTSYQDDLFGQQVQADSPCPSEAAQEALWIYYINTNISVSGMRFRWASTALRFDAPMNCTELVSDCSFEFCQVGICEQYCSTIIADSTMCRVVTPTQSLGGEGERPLSEPGSAAATPFQPLGGCASFTGNLTDTCSGESDSDGNGVADHTEYQYFGRLGTLPGHVLGQVSNRTQNHSPGDDELIWWIKDHDNNLYVYNTNCWVYGARGVPDQSQGVTALSPWNNGGEVPQQGAGTLITPRHAITTHDWEPNGVPGTVFRFIGKNNVSHSVTLVCGKDVSHFCYLWLFDQDLPSDVANVRILPDAVRHKLTPTMEHYQDPCWQSRNVPCVATSQWEDAYIADLTNLWAGGWSATFKHSDWFPDWGSHFYYELPPNRASCYPSNDQTGGDGGHPTFLLINGELVLIATWKWCGGAIWPGAFTNDLNAAIAELDNWAYISNNIPRSYYTVTPCDLSGFPDLW